MLIVLDISAWLRDLSDKTAAADVSCSACELLFADVFQGHQVSRVCYRFSRRNAR